jgi:hypothetical protein
LYYNTNGQNYKKGKSTKTTAKQAVKKKIKKSFMVIVPCSCQRSVSIETSEVEEGFKIEIRENIPIKAFNIIQDSCMSFYHTYSKSFPKIFEAHTHNNIILNGKLSPVQNIEGDTIGKYIIYGKFSYDTLLYINGNVKIKELHLK